MGLINQTVGQKRCGNCHRYAAHRSLGYDCKKCLVLEECPTNWIFKHPDEAAQQRQRKKVSKEETSKTKKELLEKKRALLMVPEATTVESIQKAEESKV